MIAVKADLAKIGLTTPVCTEVGEKIALSRRSVPVREGVALLAVLGIRIRMFLGLSDPDPLVRGTDPAPDPSLFS